LLKNKPLTLNTALTGSTPNSSNLPSGGLNLGQNMDLPNLTPTPPNGMSTELALNTSNVSPLIKDENEPTQIFGGQLPYPLQQYSASNINPNPIDVIVPAPIDVIAPAPIDVTAPAPTDTITTSPTASTTVTPLGLTPDFIDVGTLPTPINATTVLSGSSLINEPVFDLSPIKNLTTQESILGSPNTILPEPIKDQLISQCGNSFSIPNNDKEGSYTNYWFDGTFYYMQTTSPLMSTVASKISKDLFLDGCKRFQLFKMQRTK